MTFAAGQILTAADLNALIPAHASATLSATAANAAFTSVASSAVGGDAGVITAATTGITLNAPGLYLIVVRYGLSAGATGLSFIAIDTYRSSLGIGNDNDSATATINHAAAGSLLVPITVYQTSGASRTLTGNVAVTRLRTN